MQQKPSMALRFSENRRLNGTLCTESKGRRPFRSDQMKCPKDHHLSNYDILDTIVPCFTKLFSANVFWGDLVFW